MKSKKIALLVSSVLAITGLVGCNGGGAQSSVTPSSEVPSSIVPVVTGLTAEISSDKLIAADKALGLAGIEVVVEGQGEFDDSVTFKTSSDAIATVSAEGLVTALAPGKATITITSVFNPSISAQIEIEVLAPYVRSIGLNATTAYLVLGDEKTDNATIIAELIRMGAAASKTVTFTSSDPNGLELSVSEATVDDLDCAEVVLTGKVAGTYDVTIKAEDVERHVSVTVAPEGSKTPFTGAISYVDSPAEDRLEILGILERYAMKHNLTGISIMGNGGYTRFSDTVERGTDTYIPGYGFGVLAEGSIKSPLTGQGVKPEYNMYQHTYESDDPGTINYQNAKDSVVGDLVGFSNGAYWGTFMNADKDGYEWVKDLSTADRPYAITKDAEGNVTKITDKTKKSTLFRVPLNLEVKYNTLSTDPITSSYKDVKVTLEDYKTPYLIYYTQKFGMVRGSENLTGTGSIKGAEAFYNGSANGITEDLLNKLGIHTYTDAEAGEQGLEFEFNNACTPFYAMYYLASSMFAPVPASFIAKLGGGTGSEEDIYNSKAFADGTAVWGCFNSDLTKSPVDTSLSTGAYMLEKWVSDSEIVYKKNPNYETSRDDTKHYKIAGIHFDILSAIKTDKEAAWKEFEAGNLSSVGVPSSKITEWAEKPGVFATTGDSNFKINVNTCNQEQWEALFGEDGSICQTAKEDYWELEPGLSNADFVKGISFAINRKEFATKLGRTVGFEYFADTYLSDPENGESYNGTAVHQANLTALGIDDKTCGYSLESAKKCFNSAITALIASGDWKDGDTIELEIAWQTADDEDTYHALIKGYLEEAFNKCAQAVIHDLTLDVKFYAPQTWVDVYYKKMMVGQFDLGFGSVSGNSYDPLNFLEVLKSDNSSGFTLNWGIDTSAITPEIEYDDHVWSFAGLWQAADTGAYFENGVQAQMIDCEEGTIEVKADGSIVVTVDVTEKHISEDTFGEFTSMCIFATDDADYETYSEEYVTKYDEAGERNANWVVEDGVLTVTFDASLMAAFKADHPAALMFGFDIYYTQTLLGVEGDEAFFSTVYSQLGAIK